MRMWPISTRVNKPENDDPSIVEPLTSARDVRTQPLQSPSLARQARSCEMSLLVWSGISSVAMMLTTAQKAM